MSTMTNEELCEFMTHRRPGQVPCFDRALELLSRCQRLDHKGMKYSLLSQSRGLEWRNPEKSDGMPLRIFFMAETAKSPAVAAKKPRPCPGRYAASKSEMS